LELRPEWAFYFVHNGVHQSELVIHTTSLDKYGVSTETYKSLY
jgi:hypothetical protein